MTEVIDEDVQQALINIEGHNIGHQEIIWAQLRLLFADRFSQRPRGFRGDMDVLVSGLISAMQNYYQDNLDTDWNKLSYQQQLTTSYATVSLWHEEQWYDLRKRMQ